MKTNGFIFILAFLSALFCYSCSKNDVFTSTESELMSLPIFNEKVEENFFISEAVLNEYLKISQKLSQVNSIIPLMRGNDTLAYFVNYFQGWDLISADTRIESVLASSENSIGEVLNSSFLEEKFSGILDYIQSVKVDNTSTVSRLWSYLQLRVLAMSNADTKVSNSARGVVAGMWVEVSEEPEYSLEDNISPHIISTRWGQGDKWNQFMPTYSPNENYSVGCGTIAAGQVIFHFRRNNSKNIAIPNTAIMPSGFNEFPTFSNFSSNNWNNLAYYLNDNNLNVGYTAVFLSYLAEQLGAILRQDGTEVPYDNLEDILDLYELDYNYTGTYDYSRILNSLYNGRPVIVASEFNRVVRDSVDISLHYYIIDRYRERISKLTTIYEWIPDYHPTDWELQTLPQWRFEDFWADGREIMEISISRTEDTYFGMNWGEGECYIDDFYLVRTYSSSSLDDAGIVPSREIIHTPFWIVRSNVIDGLGLISYQAENVSYVLYDIKNKN